jgi:hypothetical protein
MRTGPASLRLTNKHRHNGIAALLSSALVAAAIMIFSSPVTAAPNVAGTGAKTITVLGVDFQNDHAEFEATTSAERARIGALRKQFTEALSNASRYRFVEIPDDMSKLVSAAGNFGTCGECEITLGRQLGVEQVAWIHVQKVSNLILNMNVYIRDVSSGETVFLHSVDIRGNTDESWTRSLSYLIRNYLLTD